MKTWLPCLVWSMEGLLVLGVIYFEPTCCVRGILWGEAFFEGRPTTYWSDELQHWEILAWCNCQPICRRNPTQWEQFRERWSIGTQATPKYKSPYLNLLRLANQRRRPRLLQGDPQAIPVLQELLFDRSPRVRLFAQIGLGMNPKIPGDGE